MPCLISQWLWGIMRCFALPAGEMPSVTSLVISSRYWTDEETGSGLVGGGQSHLTYK